MLQVLEYQTVTKHSYIIAGGSQDMESIECRPITREKSSYCVQKSHVMGGPKRKHCQLLINRTTTGL